MPYIVTKSSGQTLTTITDDTVDTTSTSLALVGKNYAGYGVFLNENFVKLIENFSNSAAPSSPMVGQLWYDSANTLLKIWVGTQWKQIHTSVASATAPTAEIVGDLWWDIVNLQLKIWSGSTWILIGPGSGGTTSSTSGAIVDTIIDNASQSHVVIKYIISGAVVAMVSKDAAYTPGSAITGFPQIQPGVNLISDASSRYWGTANSAVYFNGLTSGQFLRNDQNSTTTGSLTINNNGGLQVTANLNIGMGTTATNLTNQVLGNDFNIYVNKGGTETVALGLSGDSANITTGKWNATIIEPAYGGTGINNGTNRLTLAGSYTLNQDLQTTASPTHAGLTLTGAAIPNANASVNLGGATSQWWNNVYAANYYGNKFYGDGSGLTNVGAGSITGAAITLNTVNCSLGGTYTITAAAGTLTGTTLNSGVVNSSLTSVGTLTSLSVGAITSTGLINTSGNILAVQGRFGTIITTGSITPTANAAADLGTGSLRYNNIYGVTGNFLSVYANYADLAENYVADAAYAPGTVVQIGGTAEITECSQDSSNDVFGVISTKPAYLMNSALAGDNVLPVAMQGRTPVRVVGLIKKGDRLVSAGGGIARAAAASEITAFNIIGRSLEDKTADGYGTVEAIVRHNS